MAKKDVSQKVYDLTINLTRDGGCTRNLDHVEIPSKAQTLENFIPEASVRSHEEWDGFNQKTGKSKFKTVHEDVLLHAQQSISRLRFTSVTSGHRQRREEAVAKAEGQDKGSCCPSPCCEYGQPGSPVPLSAGSFKKRY